MLNRGGAVTLMYHDVVPAQSHKESGFPADSTATYKLDPLLFRQHMEAIAQKTGRQPSSVLELPAATRPRPFMLSFDDGGASARFAVADELGELGWKGHFFVTTDHINKPGFLRTNEIRELRAMGHLIGSHSCSHPDPMSGCTREKLLQEWGESIKILSDILGEKITIASVPGGYYSHEVAQTASACGIKILFTSEPTTAMHTVDSCSVLGRYVVRKNTPANEAANLASGKPLLRFKHSGLWKLKGVLKKAGGDTYLAIRRKLLKGK